MKLMKPPALGMRLVNSTTLIPVHKIATAAKTKIHGAVVPILATKNGTVRKTDNAGAMLANVLALVWNRPNDSPGSCPYSSAVKPDLVFTSLFDIMPPSANRYFPFLGDYSSPKTTAPLETVRSTLVSPMLDDGIAKRS